MEILKKILGSCLTLLGAPTFLYGIYLQFLAWGSLNQEFGLFAHTPLAVLSLIGTPIFWGSIITTVIGSILVRIGVSLFE